MIDFFCRTFGTMINIQSLPFSLLSLALITSHHITARIGKSQRVVEAVGVAVVGLGVFRVLYHNVGREHPANKRVIHPSIHVNETKISVMLVHAETTVESGTDIIVLKRVVVSISAPSVKAVIFHIAVSNGGIQTS